MRNHLSNLSAAIVLIVAALFPLRANADDAAHVWLLSADVEYTLVDDDWGSADTTNLKTSHEAIGYRTDLFELVDLVRDPRLCAGEEVRADVDLRVGVDPLGERLVARVDVDLFEGEDCDTTNLEESEIHIDEVPLDTVRGSTTEGRMVVSVCRGGCPSGVGPLDDIDRVDIVVDYRARKVAWSQTVGWWRYVGTTTITVRDVETFGADDVTVVEIGSSVLLDPRDWTGPYVLRYPGLTGHVCAGDEAVARIRSNSGDLTVEVAEGDECDPHGYFPADETHGLTLNEFFEAFFPHGVNDTRRTPRRWPFREVRASVFSHAWTGARSLDAEAIVTEEMEYLIQMPGIDEYGNQLQHVPPFDMRRQRPAKEMDLDIRVLGDRQVDVPYGPAIGRFGG